MPTLDLDDLKQIARPRRQCCVHLLLNQLPPKDAEHLRAALASPKEEYPTTLIVDWLAKAGHHLDIHSVRRYRLGRCRCDDR